MSYNSFEIVAPGGGTIIDGAVDGQTLDQMSDGKGRFSAMSYAKVLEAMTRAPNVMRPVKRPNAPSARTHF